ncbi:hypothetical protein BV20DRAFT_913647, partial [Pilatotrama ljubarskyi]
PPPRARGRVPVLPPESGRPETSQEFAKRIRRLTLHGPRREREEGGGRQIDQCPHTEEACGGPEEGHDGPEGECAASGKAREGPEGGAEDYGKEREQPITNEPLLEYISDSSEGVHLQKEIRQRYGEDPFFGDILKNPKHFKNFVVEDGLVLLKEQGRELLCIPNIIVNGRNIREIVISHAHSLLAHLGPHKTSSLLRDHVWWKT